jgi:Acyl-CoA carboxylase epsilon subunit
MTDEQAPPQMPPVLSVLRGAPTPDELAALLVVLASRQPARRTIASRPSFWSSRGHLVGAPLFPGAGAWRASGLPR